MKVSGARASRTRFASPGLACVLVVTGLLAPVDVRSITTRTPASQSVAIAAAETYSAAFVTQTVPSFIELFKPVAVSVTMRNTGTATWFSAEGDIFLATQEPQDNYFWCIQDNPHGMYSGNRVLLPHDVAPGGEVKFDFVVEPLTCGFAASAPFRFRMLSQAHGTFGEETPDPGTSLSTATEFVSQQVPETVPADAPISVTVSFRNTTQTTWRSSDGYALGSAGPAANATWGLSSVPLVGDVPPGALATFAFTIETPEVPATYNFQWQMNAQGSVPFGQGSPPTPVTVVVAGPPNYQGLWWASPAGTESGWGISFAHQGDLIFATWFTYDANGKALWLSMSAARTATGDYMGTLVQAFGPAFDIARFDPLQVRRIAVGSGTLTFDDTGGGMFSYALNGVSQTKAIVRQAFGPLPTCTFALQDDLARAYNYQDLWWAAPAESEAGWGLNLAHQGEVIFGTWFTYDHDSTPMWLSFVAQKTAAATDAAITAYAGTLYRTSGPPFFAIPFDLRQVVATPVGTASVAFSDGNAGIFSWSVDGIAGSKAITRQIFEAPGTICQ